MPLGKVFGSSLSAVYLGKSLVFYISNFLFETFGETNTTTVVNSYESLCTIVSGGLW